MTQLHDDLGAQLDAGLTQLGDNPILPGQIDDEIAGRFVPGLDTAGRPYGVLVVWLDPVQVALYGPQKSSSVQYSLRENSYQNSFELLVRDLRVERTPS